MLMMLLSLATRAAGRGSGGCEANRAHHLSTGVGAALPILTVESLLSTKLFLPWYKDTDARVIVIAEPRSFLDILFTSVFHTVTPVALLGGGRVCCGNLSLLARTVVIECDYLWHRVDRVKLRDVWLEAPFE